MSRRALLLRAARAFFLALASPLLLQPTLISPFSSFCWMLLLRGISFLLFPVWVLACDAVSFLAKHSAQASPAVSRLALRLHPRQISASPNRRLPLWLSEWSWELSPS